MLGPVQGFPLQERHEDTKKSPAKGHWLRDRSSFPMRRGWDAYVCSAWRREDSGGCHPRVQITEGRVQRVFSGAHWENQRHWAQPENSFPLNIKKQSFTMRMTLQRIYSRDIWARSWGIGSRWLWWNRRVHQTTSRGVWQPQPFCDSDILPRHLIENCKKVLKPRKEQMRSEMLPNLTSRKD